MINLTNDQLSDLADACACAEILWRKRRQQAQGLIDLGTPKVWDEDECTEQMKRYRSLFTQVSLATHE